MYLQNTQTAILLITYRDVQIVFDEDDLNITVCNQQNWPKVGQTFGQTWPTLRHVNVL